MTHAYTCPKCGKLVPWLIEKDGVLVCGDCFKGPGLMRRMMGKNGAIK